MMDFSMPVNGGLVVPRVLNAGEAAATEAHLRWKTFEGVLDELRGWKVPDNEEPTVECPVITAEVLLTPDKDTYTRAFSGMRIWYGYAIRLLARVNAELLQVENEMSDIEATMRKKLRKLNEGRTKTERMTAEEIRDEVTTDDAYRVLRVDEQRLRQFKLELSAWVDDLDRTLKLISRQVEIRRDDTKGGTNEQNMSRRATNPGTHGTFT